jgi:hypothetical protein
MSRSKDDKRRRVAREAKNKEDLRKNVGEREKKYGGKLAG